MYYEIKKVSSGCAVFPVKIFLCEKKVIERTQAQSLLKWDLKTIGDNIPPLTEFPLTSSLRIHKAFGIFKLMP